MALMAAGAVLIVSAALAILQGRAEAVSPAWAWVGALACPFLVVQLARATVALLRGGCATVTSRSIRLLLILFVAVWVSVLIWGQPFHPVRAYMALGLWIGLFSALLTFRASLLQVIPARPLRIAELLLTNLALVLIGGEVALRAISVLFPAPILTRVGDSARDVLSANRIAPGTVRHGYEINSAGHYDREFSHPPREELLIASIGDSFSAGSVPLPYHFTKVLEDRLPEVSVYNLGVPAIGPPEYHRLLVTEALPLEPDFVLVNIFIGNDVGEARGRYRPVVGSWFDRDNVLIYLVTTRALSVLREDLPESSLGLATPETLASMFPWVLDPMLEPPGTSEEAFLRIESERASQMLLPDSLYPPLFEWITRMRQSAGEIPLAIMLIPDEYQVEDDLWDRILEQFPDRQPERFRHQRVIGAWLQEQGIPYLDLLSLFRSAEPLSDGRRHLYHLRETHFNVRGNRLAGDALADFFAARFGLKRR